LPTATDVQVAAEKAFADSSDCQRGMMVAYALHSFAMVNIEEIAPVVNRTPSAVSHAIRTIRARLEKDATLAARMEGVPQKCGICPMP
jgi:hypothetical protein